MPTNVTRRTKVIAGACAAALVLIVLAGFIVRTRSTEGAPVARAHSTRLESTPTASPAPTVPATPPEASQAELAAVPVAFFDAVVPALPDPATLNPKTTWQIATPIQPLTALYADPGADATPIAALGATIPTIVKPTAVAVYGRQGDMLLISTPSRRTVPSAGAPAPSATFAWARAADFAIAPIDQIVTVDDQTSTIAIVTREGQVETSETARLGTPDDPTPVATSTYMEANYVDPQVSYTEGNPIALTGAHSSLLASFGGNSALTALHYYPGSTGNSHGCVRVSATMTAALAQLPVGTPIVFS